MARDPSASILPVSTPFLRFAAVGGATTLLDLAAFAALTGPGGLAGGPANVVSYSSGVATSFVLNGWWTFAATGDEAGRDRKAVGRAREIGGRALRFALTNAAGLVLSTLLVIALSALLPALLAKVASVPLVFAWNYLTARFWVFRPA